MENFLMDNVIEKVNGLEKRSAENEKILSEIKENVSGLSGQSQNLNELAQIVQHLQQRMQQIIWPLQQMNELTSWLKMNHSLFSNPVKTKQTVVHTAGKLGWVMAFLLLAIISLAIGLLETASRLKEYKTNDLLWRYVKVVSKNKNLEYLQTLENLHLKDPEKMKFFVDEEELRQKHVITRKTKKVNQMP